MKTGDLVSVKSAVGKSPVALVVDSKCDDSKFHKRIRVMWLDENLPIQSKAFSINGSRISTWVEPRHFILSQQKYGVLFAYCFRHYILVL